MEEINQEINDIDQNGQNLNMSSEQLSSIENMLLDNPNVENEIEIKTDKNTENDVKTDQKSEKEDKNEQISLNLGKFKDVESLLSAYNNLQAEFTKKCQKLSELTKTCDNNADALPQQQWAEKVNTFLSNNQEAKPYAKEISNVLLSNTELYNSENGLEKAWTKVLLDNVLSLKQQMQDESYIEEIINNNNELKQKIINEYISTIKTNQSPLLMDKSGTSFAISKAEKVLNLEDASALVRAMFK